MKISEHVYFYRSPENNLMRGSANSNSFVIRGRRMALIDPGGPGGNLDRLAAEMKRDGLELKNVAEIWLTHAHPDHAAGAPELQERLDIPVRCSEPEAETMARPESLVERERRAAGAFVRKVFPYPDWLVGGFFWWFWNAWPPLDKVSAFKPEAGLDLGVEVRVTPLPGHCDGEVGFWIESDRTLIIGDLLNAGKGRLPSINMPSSDLGLAAESIERIRSLDPERILAGHSQPFPTRESAQNATREGADCCAEITGRVEAMLHENPVPDIRAMTTRLFHDLPRIHFFERPALTYAALKRLGALDRVSP